MGGSKFIWDTPEYGKPGSVTPSKISDQEAFDRSPMVNQMMNQLAGSTGQQQAKALSAASKLGVGRSSGTVGQLQGIAADTENRMQTARQQAALDTFKEQMAQAQWKDQMAMDKYKSDLAMYEAEKAKRRSALGPLGMFVS